MMGDIPPGWVALAVAIVTAVGSGGYFAQRGRNKIDLLDQYQEDRKSDRERMDKQDVKIETQDSKIQVLLRREITMRNYVLDLRNHIDAGKPPPPPEMPHELLT